MIMQWNIFHVTHEIGVNDEHTQCMSSEVPLVSSKLTHEVFYESWTRIALIFKMCTLYTLFSFLLLVAVQIEAA